MKQVQTFKFDPDLIAELKNESGSVSSPFNRYVENLLRTHPYRIKLVITHPDRKKKKMIKNTYYSRDYERWITPIDSDSDTYCLVFGTTAAESRQRAQTIYKLLGLVDEPNTNSNHGDRHSGWSV